MNSLELEKHFLKKRKKNKQPHNNQEQIKFEDYQLEKLLEEWVQ